MAVALRILDTMRRDAARAQPGSAGLVKSVDFKAPGCWRIEFQDASAILTALAKLAEGGGGGGSAEAAEAFFRALDAAHGGAANAE